MRDARCVGCILPMNFFCRPPLPTSTISTIATPRPTATPSRIPVPVPLPVTIPVPTPTPRPALVSILAVALRVTLAVFAIISSSAGDVAIRVLEAAAALRFSRVSSISGRSRVAAFARAAVSCVPAVVLARAETAGALAAVVAAAGAAGVTFAVTAVAALAVSILGLSAVAAVVALLAAARRVSVEGLGASRA